MLDALAARLVDVIRDAVGLSISGASQIRSVASARLSIPN